MAFSATTRSSTSRSRLPGRRRRADPPGGQGPRWGPGVFPSVPSSAGLMDGEVPCRVNAGCLPDLVEEATGRYQVPCSRHLSPAMASLDQTWDLGPPTWSHRRPAHAHSPLVCTSPPPRAPGGRTGLGEEHAAEAACTSRRRDSKRTLTARGTPLDAKWPTSGCKPAWKQVSGELVVPDQRVHTSPNFMHAQGSIHAYRRASSLWARARGAVREGCSSGAVRQDLGWGGEGRA